MKSDLVDVHMMLKAETEKAVLVYDDTPDRAIWLPKSQIEIERKGALLVTVTMPEWLAHKHGLV